MMNTLNRTGPSMDHSGTPLMVIFEITKFFLLFIFYCQYVIQNTIHNYASVTKQTYTATVFKIRINLCSLTCLQNLVSTL